MAHAKPVNDDSNVVSFPGSEPEEETVRSDVDGQELSADTPDVTEPEVEAVRMGPFLAETREAQGLDRATLAEELRISARYLSAIETMSVGPIPKGYLSAYLRTYAKRLGLDADDVVTKFTQQCGAVEEINKPKPIEPVPQPKSGMSAPVVIGGVVALCAVIAAVGLFVFAPRPEAPIPIVTTGAGPVNGARQSLFDEAPAQAAAPVTLPLTLTAQRSAWIEVRGEDGTIFRSRVMAAGEVYHPRIGAGWTISARDGGAFEWHVGDVAVGPLGPQGAAVYAVGVDAIAAEAAADVSPDLAETAGTTEPR